MSVRMRHTRSHTANRRSHHALDGARLGKCEKCGAPRLAHAMCARCGAYRGRIVVDVVAELSRKEKKAKKKSAAR